MRWSRTAWLPAAMTLVQATSLLAQDVRDRARAAADSARAKSADSDALQGNYLNPGLASQPISTVDGSRTFTPSIACQKTTTFLELMAQPSATGDIGNLRIARDRDMDGAFDQVITLPVPVSGICANGVIACDPGSWNACRSFKWDGADNGLALTEAGLTQLSGCYCVNNSCGTNLVWGNMASVLKDLGGGVIGAMTSADPRIGVAEASIDGPVIRYSGAQTTACQTNPAVPQSSYRANPSALGSDAYAASQGSSVFQTLLASPAGIGKSAENRSCAIRRNVSIREITPQDVIQVTSGGYATSNPASDTIEFLMGSPSDNTLHGGACTLFDFRMTLHVEDASRLREVRLPYYFFDDWLQLRIDGQLVLSDPSGWTGSGYPPGACERSKTWYAYPNLDLKPWLTNGDHEIWMRVAVGDAGELSAMIRAVVDTGCAVTETISDGCLGNAGDPACSLADETVDGVATFRNGVGTGLKPLPQARTIGPGACSTMMTRDFWERERRYQCSASVSTPDLSRSAYIIDHSTETLLADRTKSADGTVTSSTRPFSLPDRGTVSSCEAICKTRAPKANSAVAVDGVVGDRQNSPTGWDTFYHSCSADNVCPVGTGEELVTGCGCLDDFPEAVVMMQTVRLGGADLVCTGTGQ